MRNPLCLDFGRVYVPFLLHGISSSFRSEELKIDLEFGKSSQAEERWGGGERFNHVA